MQTHHFVIAAAFVAALALTLCGGGLAWDGSYYLFQILDRQEPFVVHGRLGLLALHTPVLLAARAGAELPGLAAIFSATHALVPVAALVACWIAVRRVAPHLFTWGVLGICLTTVGGQLFLVSEAVIASQLAWPALLWIAAGAPRDRGWVAAASVAGVLLLHPAAVPLLTAAGLLALARGLRRVAVVLLVIAGARFALLLSGIVDPQAIALADYAAHFRSALKGLPIAALLCTWLAGAALTARRQRVRLLAPAFVGIAGVLLVIWAGDAARWSRAIEFRSWAPFVGLPLVALLWRDARGAGERTLHGRVGVAAALVFAVVVSVQAIEWRRVVRTFEDELRDAPACAPAASFASVSGGPLAHWSVAPLSLLVQGRAPSRLVVKDAGACDAAVLRESVPLASWHARPRDAGWFRLERTAVVHAEP